jgi:hypothetical protein
MRGATEDETMTASVTMGTRERSPHQARHNLRRAPEPELSGAHFVGEVRRSG